MCKEYLKNARGGIACSGSSISALVVLAPFHVKFFFEVDVCSTHRCRYVPGRQSPKILLSFFSYQISAHPGCKVTKQLSVLGVLCCSIFNVALKTEVILECMSYLCLAKRCNYPLIMVHYFFKI